MKNSYLFKTVQSRFKYLFLFSFCSVLFLGAFAQRRPEGREMSHRDNSAGQNRQPHIQQSTRPSNNREIARAPHRDYNGQRPGRVNQQRPVDRYPSNPGNRHSANTAERYPNHVADRHPSNIQGRPGYHNNPTAYRGNRYPNGADRYHRPVFYNAHNPGWRYSYLPRRNAIITSFPFAYQTINYGGYGYRYYDGIYYRPYNNVFRVVAPPFGLYINTLPIGYSRILVNDNPYYYYNGTYYDDYDNSYRVVAPPVGAVVESIPEGYETVVIDGETYYQVDGVQYKPVTQDNGEIWYEVTKVDGNTN